MIFCKSNLSVLEFKSCQNTSISTHQLSFDDSIRFTGDEKEGAAAVSSVKVEGTVADEGGSLVVEEGTEAAVALTGRSGLTITGTPPPHGLTSPEPWPKVTEETPGAVDSATALSGR